MLVQLSSTSYNLSNLCGIATGTAGKKSHIDAPNRRKKKEKKRTHNSDIRQEINIHLQYNSKNSSKLL
jgi:hypothetical protein